MSQETNYTYVLFGEEAIFLYKVSINQFVLNADIDFKVGAYTSIKDFMAEKNNWKDCLEIDKASYKVLKKIYDKKNRKKKSFFNMNWLFN